MKSNKITSRLVLLLLMAVCVCLFIYYDVSSYLALEAIKSNQALIDDYYRSYPLKTLTVFFLSYVLITALSLPGAVIMTLIAGALFGNLTGLIVVSFASTLGATLAFLVSRFLLRNWIQEKFAVQLKSINQGIEKEGAFYLFTLRLVPLFPFFVINLLMGLTRMKVLTFMLVSQIGMLAGTAVFINAGTQIAHIDSLQGILSPSLIFSFSLLGLFPLFSKKLIEILQARKVYKGFKKPTEFEHNIIVIGAGSGGLVSAYIAAAVKAKVTLIEKHKMGGDCLNTGCVPSKALIKSAKLLHQMKHAEKLGIKSAQAEFDFADVMDRVQQVIKEIEPHDSIDRYSQLGVNVIQGEAKIISPYTVEVNGQILTTKNIIIATGARPFVPHMPGLENIDYLTSDNLWQCRELPERLLILGAGPIGCELAQAFARLGSKVTQVQRGERIMPREDPEFSALVMASFQRDSIQFKLKHAAKEIIIENNRKYLLCETEGEPVRIEFDQLLIALGRSANISDFGLEQLNIPLRKNNTIETNEFLQTNYPNIYAVGDVTGPYQFTHTAAHQAWYASVNSLFGSFKKFRVDYSVIPWATFTDPEIARVGLNEQEAQAQNIAYEVTSYGIDDLDRSIADGTAEGKIKVLTVPGKDKILGVTIAGEHAGELIIEFVTAMKYNLGLNKILGTIHIYPTLAEANKYVAGNWKKNHKPEKLLRWVEKFHQWMRDS
ncbi:MAG: FAD-dependent oxidoreductase [gamma proteobacterium symbiont of Taylorina sp.]|nr:FAD-dependent oxidoreductase [gamma proteobacterium symbiont of Taylorina sp.]